MFTKCTDDRVNGAFSLDKQAASCLYMTEKSLPSLLKLNICRNVDVHGPVPPLATHNVLENYRNTSENLALTCVMLFNAINHSAAVSSDGRMTLCSSQLERTASVLE